MIARQLITCKYMSLPNLVANQQLMPEYIIVGSPNKQVAQISAHLQTWLSNSMTLARAAKPLLELRDQLVRTGATATAARTILEKLAPATQRQSRAA